jgi:hypothetical protein
VHGSRFFTRHVAGRRRDDAGAPAEVGRALSQGVPQCRVRRPVFDPDIKDDAVGANRARREQRSIDHQVRPGRHQRSVLET